jgi:hypothetical protein
MVCLYSSHMKTQRINLANISTDALQMLVNNVSGLTDECLAQYYIQNGGYNASFAYAAVVAERNRRNFASYTPLVSNVVR